MLDAHKRMKTETKQRQNNHCVFIYGFDDRKCPRRSCRGPGGPGDGLPDQRARLQAARALLEPGRMRGARLGVPLPRVRGAPGLVRGAGRRARHGGAARVRPRSPGAASHYCLTLSSLYDSTMLADFWDFCVESDAAITNLMKAKTL